MRAVSVFLFVLALIAQNTAAMAQSRVALVVGNGAYRNTSTLANPLNDARDVAAALKSAGFDVVEAFDADKQAFDTALRSFTDKLTNADVGLFFYAGHGLQVGAQNYLVPIDARLERERDLEFEAVKLDFVLRQMEIDREGKTSIVFLDACRDNPLSRNLARSMGTRSAAIGRGLAAAATGLGTFIAYSTQPGNVALDGEGRNSPFTAALVKHMGASGRNLPATMIEVRKDVVAATGGRQVPWDHSALTGDFYFTPGAAIAQSTPNTAASAGAQAQVAALQERLDRLENQAKRRESPALGADALKLAELRARAANLEDLTKELQRKVLNARMAEGKAETPAERQKLQQTSIDIQMEWSRRGQDLKKLREEIAALENSKATSLTSSFKFPKSASRSVGGVDVYDDMAIAGALLTSQNADSLESCASLCRATPDCVGAMLTAVDALPKGRRECVVFGSITETRQGGGTTLVVTKN
jgi:uncharacterized caspase-like protein